MKLKILSLIRECDTAIMWHKGELERLKQRTATLREKSELGERFKCRTFGSLDGEIDQGALAICKAYAEKFSRVRRADRNGIILSGLVGIGKTHLAAAIANMLIDEKSVQVFFQNVPLMFEKMKREFGKTDFTSKTARECELLILDDLGKEKRTEWTDERLYEIVNTRYEKRLPIIVTTNLTATDFAERLDYSTSSRLVEMCRFVAMGGKDRRI